MNLDLTQEQAQAVISSQAAQLKALKLRMRRAHVTMKYLVRASVNVTVGQVNDAIAHLNSLIDSDSEQAERTGYSDIDHRVVEQRIEELQAFLDSGDTKRWNRVKLPVLSYHYQFIVNGYDDSAASNVAFETNELMNKYLWRDGEPLTPNFFSSPPGKDGLDME